jgi:glycosyltransferase involved in cell wall biosynthesis
VKTVVFLPHNPVPCRSGAHYRMLEMLAGLRALGHSVTIAACENAAENPWSNDAGLQLQRDGLCTDVAVFRDPENISYARLLTRAWHAVAGKSGLWARRTARGSRHEADLTHGRLRRWFARLLESEQPDCILINYAWFSRLATCAQASRRPLMVLDAHDLVSLSAGMRAAVSRYVDDGVVFSPDAVPEAALNLGFYQSLRLAPDPAEFSALDRVDVTFAITEQDAGIMREKTIHTKIVALPTPVVAGESRPPHGALALFPMGPNPFNLQGYAWFVRKVLPRIRAACEDFQLGVSGTFNRPLTLEYNRNVRILGFVANSSTLWSMGRMLVNPVFGGTGQPIKTLEAMAAGLAPVIFERFAHAAPVVHGVSGFVAKDEHDFAAYCIRLWKDPTLCSEMGAAAMEAVRTECSREAFVHRLGAALGPT